jgi:hypothetical protein
MLAQRNNPQHVMTASSYINLIFCGQASSACLMHFEKSRPTLCRGARSLLPILRRRGLRVRSRPRLLRLWGSRARRPCPRGPTENVHGCRQYCASLKLKGSN